MKSLKKYIIIILIIAMIMSFVPITTKVEAATLNSNYFNIGSDDGLVQTSAIPGDVNLDGYVTNRDKVLLDRHLVGIYLEDDQAIFNADANRDGICQSNDSTVIARYVSGALTATGVNEVKLNNAITLYGYYSQDGSDTGEKVSSGISWVVEDEDNQQVASSSLSLFQFYPEKAGDYTITATYGNYYDTFVIHAVESRNKNMATGVTMESENIMANESTHKVNFTIDSSLMDKTLAGATIRIVNYHSNTSALELVDQKDDELKIDVLTEGWEVTEHLLTEDSSHQYLDLSIEPTQDLLESGIPEDSTVEFDVNFDVVTSSSSKMAKILITNLTRTDEFNNVHKSIDTTIEYAPVIVLTKESSTSPNPDEPLTVADGYEDDIKIVENQNRIYVKLDSSKENNGYSYNVDLIQKLTSNIEGYQELYLTNKDSAGRLYTGTKLNIQDKTGSGATVYKTYTVYLIGDCYLDSAHKIDINDVTYLRKDIVGYDMLAYEDDGLYTDVTTDVNWSNGTPDKPYTGDIGDVIAIRKRVLKFTWDDTVPTVSTPPTTAVSQKTKYKDKNGDIAVIPRGFKVSSNSKEQTIDDGLVVIAKDGSEFVWIPVEDASTMYGIDSDGNYLGKLYEDGDLSSPLNWTESGGVMKWTLTSGSESNREPALLSSYDTDSQYYSDIAGFTNQTQFENSMKNKFEEMVKYVDQYGGFYIGRYETSFGKSTNGITKAQSVKNVESMTADSDSANTWYGLYKYHSSYSEFLGEVDVLPEVGSSMIYGSQYDQMMIWLNSNEIDVTSATPNGASRNTSRITGSRDNDKLNNIYDLLGNSFEWTLEASYTYSRVSRRRLLQQ